MSAKYTSLLEACDKVQLTGKLGILEESSLDEAASIKMQLMLNENLTFIKNQITRTPLVENIQVALAEKWTQAILEDISLENPFVQPDEGLTAGEMAAAGALGAGALGAGARYAAPAAQAAYNARANSGANLTGTMMAAKQAAATPFNNDVAAVRNAAASTAQAAAYPAGLVNQAVRNAAGNATQAAKNQAGAAAAGFSGIQGPAKPGTQTAYKVGSTVGKVKRVFTK